MTALGKLFRTTTFKLTLVYLTVFALFAAFLLAYFAWNTRRLVTQQIVATVDAEMSGLSDLFQQGGIRRLIFAIDDRGSRPGSSLYLLTTAAGEGVTGNIGSLTSGILDKSGWTETAYRRIDDSDTAAEHQALVRVLQLPGGFRLLVGRDLQERERLHDIIISAGRWSIAIVVVLGIAGGFFVTRRVLKRVDAMTGTTQRIMAGDLSGRLPIAGSNDELDRLAGNLNVMLERIEALMHGLKEVTDNIAHDLKTPLTRLRNRAEEALRTAEDESQYRAALERTIEESDGLIRTFNALLMIARAESGQARDGMTELRRRRDRAGDRRALRAARRRQGFDLAGRSGRVGADARQPRADQPGAREPGRQRHQICGAGQRHAGAGLAAAQRRAARDRGEGGWRWRPHPAHRCRQRPRHPRGRPHRGRSSASSGWSRAGRCRARGWA